MIRRLGALAVAGLVLCACGSLSASTATANWVRESDYAKNNATLVRDVQHAAGALADRASTGNQLHTVCGVLYTDTEAANAALPTPDAQATRLLSRAYSEIGDGGDECYVAASSASERARALASLAAGLASLSEAAARLATATA